MRQQRQRAEVTFRWGHRPPLVLVSVPSWSALCRQPLPPLRLSHAFIRGGLGASLGFACMRRVGFKPFWPLALVHQALPAIILAALRRFRGAALFHGSPPSPRLGAPFWPSGLTLRSSGPAFCGPLTLAVSTTENQFISPMLFQTAFNFSSVVQRWVCRFSGLRLLALRWCVVFLASSPCAASASSYRFCSAVPPRWHCAFSQFVPVAKFRLSVLASGSNISVKPARILRSAYLAR